MRIDLLLKYLCLVKSRSSAKNLCGKGDVHIDGRAVRPSATAKEGDRLTIINRSGTLEVKVLQLPDKQLSRALAPDYYERISWTSAEGIDLDY